MKFLRSLLSNLTSLLLAFVLAVIIWVRASQAVDPLESRLLQIPLEFINLPEGSVLLEPDPDNQEVSVVVEAPASMLPRLPDVLAATLDLSEVPFGREVSVPIRTQSNDPAAELLSHFPERMNVLLEQSVMRQVPVVLDIRGNVARGHVRGEPLIEPEFIAVEGPASRVEDLESARATIFLNNEREAIVRSPLPIFYDRQGRVASVSGLRVDPEQVTVTIPVDESADFAEKLITVNWVGEPAEGYRLLGVSADPPSVLVQGSPSRLSTLTQVQTEQIDITGLTESFRQRVTLNLPAGITLGETEEIFVDIEIEPFLTTSTYNRVPELQGLAEELEATVEPDEVRVVLFGPLPILDSLVEEEVRVTVDLFDRGVGVYSLEPDISWPDRPGIELRSVQPSAVTVSITRAMTITNELTATIPVTSTASLLSPLSAPQPRPGNQVDHGGLLAYHSQFVASLPDWMGRIRR